VQNVRTLDAYYERLDAQVLPVLRGIELNADDLIRREVIQRLMCDFDLDFAAIEAAHGIRFAEYFAPDLAALAPLAADGLAEVDALGIKVTPRGRLLVRTVAMQFDRYLREAGEAQYQRHLEPAAPVGQGAPRRVVRVLAPCAATPDPAPERRAVRLICHAPIAVTTRVLSEPRHAPRVRCSLGDH
jgi:hypothetical protein